MRKMIGLSLAVLVLVGAVKSTASTKIIFNSPQAAAENHRPVKNLIRFYEREGYQQYNSYESPYRYFAAPESDYDWGSVTYQLKSTNPMDADTVTLIIHVRRMADVDGFKISGFDVRNP